MLMIMFYIRTDDYIQESKDVPASLLQMPVNEWKEEEIFDKCWPPRDLQFVERVYTKSWDRLSCDETHLNVWLVSPSAAVL